MKKNNIPINPLRPYVTLEQILAFRVDDVETHTCSPLVNAVLTAFDVVGVVSTQAVAVHLGLNVTKLSNALQIATGYNLTEIRMHLVRMKYEKLRNEHPEWKSTEMTRQMGFKNIASLFKLLGKQRYDAELANYTKK